MGKSYWIKEINAACLECLLFEKLTAGRMDGETDQKNFDLVALCSAGCGKLQGEVLCLTVVRWTV